jgi:hypothetical protein
LKRQSGSTFDPKPTAQSEGRIISSSARAQAIWGDRANGLTQRIALGDDGKRFVVHADEKLTAFLELERAIHEFAVDLIS